MTQVSQGAPTGSSAPSDQPEPPAYAPSTVPGAPLDPPPPYFRPNLAPRTQPSHRPLHSFATGALIGLVVCLIIFIAALRNSCRNSYSDHKFIESLYIGHKANEILHHGLAEKFEAFMMTVMGQVCMQQVKSLETDLKDGLGVDVMAFASRLGHGDAGIRSSKICAESHQ